MTRFVILIVFCLGLNSFSFSQFSCDSIFIDSVQFQSNPTNGIQLLAKNHNADIVSYPGFILFDGNGDTIAKEVVNYFGIGNGYQLHLLEWINPMILPFSGYLELHSGFYDSLRCTFAPIIFADTSLSISESLVVNFNMFPNPSDGEFQISFDAIFSGEIEVVNSLGQSIQKKKYIGVKKVTISEQLDSGIYFIRCRKSNSRDAFTRKLIVSS